MAPRLETAPFLGSPGPPTATERPWEGIPGPEGAAEGSPVPVAAGTRSGAAAGGTDWQPRAPCRSPRGGAVALDRWSSALRASLPLPPFLPASPSPAPSAVSDLWTPGCRTAVGARPGRRVNVQHWVLGARGAWSGLGRLPWPLPRAPYLESPGLSRRPLGSRKPGTPRLDAGAGWGWGRLESLGLVFLFFGTPRCKFPYLSTAVRPAEAKREVQRL